MITFWASFGLLVSCHLVTLIVMLLVNFKAASTERVRRGLHQNESKNENC